VETSSNAHVSISLFALSVHLAVGSGTGKVLKSVGQGAGQAVGGCTLDRLRSDYVTRSLEISLQSLCPRSCWWIIACWEGYRKRHYIWRWPSCSIGLGRGNCRHWFGGRARVGVRRHGDSRWRPFRGTRNLLWCTKCREGYRRCSHR
jgi:hypothetical protein